MIGPPPRTDDIRILRDYVEQLYNWIVYPDKLECQFIEMQELSSDIDAPGTNRVRIYTVDSGGGKTKLAARFATGAVQQLGVEP